MAWTSDDSADGPPPEDAALDRAIASGDIDEVLREVDRRADAGDWVHASTGELPAATVTARPSAIPAATASFRIWLRGPTRLMLATAGTPAR
jgi:hypothetical protein